MFQVKRFYYPIQQLGAFQDLKLGTEIGWVIHRITNYHCISFAAANTYRGIVFRVHLDTSCGNIKVRPLSFVYGSKKSSDRSQSNNQPGKFPDAS